MTRHAYSPRHHASECGLCGGKSYAAVHAPTEQEYRRRRREEAKVEAPRRSSYRPIRCRNCGYDVRGLYGSDRSAHTDGWCTNL